jgi:hypothetical protein
MRTCDGHHNPKVESAIERHEVLSDFCHLHSDIVAAFNPVK